MSQPRLVEHFQFGCMAGNARSISFKRFSLENRFIFFGICLDLAHRFCGCFHIHPHQLPDVTVEIFKAATIHETVILLGSRISATTSLSCIFNRCIHIRFAVRRKTDQNFTCGIGVGNLLGVNWLNFSWLRIIAWIVSEKTMQDAVSSENIGFFVAPIAS